MDTNKMGRPGRDHEQDDQWLDQFLDNGYVPWVEIERAGKEIGMSRSALYESKKRIKAVGLEFEDEGASWGKATKLYPNPAYSSAMDGEPSVTSESLKKQAEACAKSCPELSQVCLELMQIRNREHPATPPYSEEDVIEIWHSVFSEDFFAFLKAEVQAAKERAALKVEIDRVVATLKSDSDLAAWRAQQHAAHRRPATPEENEKKRAEERATIQATLKALNEELAELPNRTTVYTEDNVDEVPDIQEHIKAYPARRATKSAPCSISAMPALKTLRQKYIGMPRPLSDEQLKAEGDRISAGISQKLTELAAVDTKTYVMNGATNKDREYMELVSRAWDRRWFSTPAKPKAADPFDE
jgi:hypothetical protein